MEYSDAHGYADERGLLLERHEHFTETQPGVWVADGAVPPSKLVLRGEGNLVIIGTGADCTGAEIVVIGNQSIYRAATGERINQTRDIEVGRHVWIGRDSRVSKGAVIGFDSIIGQGSIVTGKKCSKPGGLYAGAPAVEMDSGITWSRMDAESWDEMTASARHQAYLGKVAALRSRCVTAAS